MKPKLSLNSKGMSLIELTVVILVLLSLISVLFIGVKAWKGGADKSSCLLLIRNMQVAVRSWQNMNAKETGDPCAVTDLYASGFVQNPDPQCPAGGQYDKIGEVPSVGTLYMTCELATAKPPHVPADTNSW